MTTIKITKLNAAINQLQMAIDMFLKNQDLFCIITLAGAAEEILGYYAQKANETKMIDLLCSSLKKEHGIVIPDKIFKSAYLNKARNTLKHFNENDSETIEVDAESEATTMIIRAIGNLYSHDRSITHNTPAFLSLINEQRVNPKE